MSFSVTKSTIESYKIRTREPYGVWADITVDGRGPQGRLQIASDYGDWQYYWSACGTSFKAFLLSLSMDYVARKFGADRHFDVDATILRYRCEVLEERKKGWLEAGTARRLWDALQELAHSTEPNEFTHLFFSERTLTDRWETPDLEYGYTPGFRAFFTQLWPVFCDHLRKELQQGEGSPQVMHQP